MTSSKGKMTDLSPLSSLLLSPLLPLVCSNLVTGAPICEACSAAYWGLSQLKRRHSKLPPEIAEMPCANSQAGMEGSRLEFSKVLYIVTLCKTEWGTEFSDLVPPQLFCSAVSARRSSSG